jgi:hypothetical protein
MMLKVMIYDAKVKTYDAEGEPGEQEVEYKDLARADHDPPHRLRHCLGHLQRA